MKSKHLLTTTTTTRTRTVNDELEAALLAMSLSRQTTIKEEEKSTVLTTFDDENEDDLSDRNHKSFQSDLLSSKCLQLELEIRNLKDQNDELNRLMVSF